MTNSIRLNAALFEMRVLELAAWLEAHGYPFLGVTLEHKLYNGVAPDVSFWHDGTAHVVYVFYARSEPPEQVMEGAKAWLASDLAADPDAVEIGYRLIVVGHNRLCEHYA